MYAGVYVKYPFSCQILMKLEFSRQIFEKYPNTRFNENLSGNKYCHVTSVKPMSYIIHPSSARYN